MKKMALAGLVVLAACAGANQDPEKVSLSFQTQLDSGNVAYRRGDFEASAQYFYKATKSDPENLSGWYGVYMAESKLGNKEAAAKARAVVAKKAPEMPLTAHPTAADHPGGGAVPSNPHGMKEKP